MTKRKFSFIRFKDSIIAWILGIVITFIILSGIGYLFYGISLLLGSPGFNDNGIPFIVNIIGVGVIGLLISTILIFIVGGMCISIKDSFNYFFPIQKD